MHKTFAVGLWFLETTMIDKKRAKTECLNNDVVLHIPPPSFYLLRLCIRWTACLKTSTNRENMLPIVVIRNDDYPCSSPTCIEITQCLCVSRLSTTDFDRVSKPTHWRLRPPSFIIWPYGHISFSVLITTWTRPWTSVSFRRVIYDRYL